MKINITTIPHDNELFPIRTVAELTGVNSITLRAWESRHKLIEPVRKQSGHRVYSQENINQIRRIIGLLDKGMRIGQVKAALGTAESHLDVNGKAPETIWQTYINGMIAAIYRLDESGLERNYGEALSHYSVRTVNRELLSPLLLELSKRWESGERNLVEEHFFDFYLRNRLGTRFHHRLQNQQGPMLLLAGLPGDMREIGLLMHALAASDMGFRITVLGANMPLNEVLPAAQKIASDATVLTGAIAADSSVLQLELPQLVRDSSTPVFVGGSSSVINFDGIKSAGAYPLGSDIDSGLKTISFHLDNRHGKLKT